MILSLDVLICDLVFLCVDVLISLSYLCVMFRDFMFAFLRRPTPLREVGRQPPDSLPVSLRFHISI